MTGYHKKIGHFEDLKQLNRMASRYDWILDYDLEEKLLRKGLVILVTDPLLSISFASSNMTDMNGYQPKEVMGKSPAIFQGPDTSDSTRTVIREAIRELAPFHVSMVNYRKNGSIYHCDIDAFPVYNKQGRHAHFMAFEKLIDHDA